MKDRTYRGVALTLCGIGLMALGLQGCATTSTEARQVRFPAPEDAWIDEGTYVNLENLRKMQVGVSKDQMYELLGRPHFSEGIFGVRQWNYIFNLPNGEDGYMKCQYQVQFDDVMLAESMHWQKPGCAALLEPREDEPTRMMLSADTLFDFDSARLLPEGERQIAELARRIRGDFASPGVMVVGHTDRIGSDDYNQSLSERRAETVRSALVGNGIMPSAIRSRGVGERQPVTRCEGSRATPDLKACLQPNRRVDIEVSDEQR